MCLVSAQKAGDPYPIREVCTHRIYIIFDADGVVVERVDASHVLSSVDGSDRRRISVSSKSMFLSLYLLFLAHALHSLFLCLFCTTKQTMIADGIGTLIGALLGSPFGTVIYIGHPVHKRVGAQTGYSLMNGCIYLVLALSGIIPVVLSLIPAIAIGPIIFIFGLMICEDCTRHIDQRHHAAIFFGLFFGLCDYIYLTFSPSATLNGQNAMSKGSALASMIWVSIIVYTVDRRWIRTAIFCVIGAFFAGAGLIHQDSAFENFMEGFQGIDNSSPFQFMMGYLSLAGVSLIYYFLQTTQGKQKEEGEEGYEDDHGYLPPIPEDEDESLFKTWWDPASTPLKDMPNNKMLNGEEPKKSGEEEMGSSEDDKKDSVEEA